MHHAKKKRDQSTLYILHNFHKFKCTVVAYGKQYLEDTAKLLLQQMSNTATLLCKMKCSPHY